MRIASKIHAARYTAVVICASLASCAPALAQGFQWDANALQAGQGGATPQQIAASYAAAVGTVGKITARTGAGQRGTVNRIANPTSQQNGGLTLTTGTALLTPGGLPSTSLDSFVMNAGGNAELIYGDEGTDDIPPYFGFDQSHRIISGIDSAGLTTYHGSMLPNAWGGDEFDMPEGPSFSGANGASSGSPSGGEGGGYGGGGGYGAGPSTGNLSALAETLPGTSWAQIHPRQTDVLTNASNVYNQINADQGALGGNYNQLSNQALAIQNADVNDAAQNGGYITLQQEGQLDQQAASLSQQVQQDSGF